MLGLVLLATAAAAREEAIKVSTYPADTVVTESGREVARARNHLADWTATVEETHTYRFEAPGYEPAMLDLTWGARGWELPHGEPLAVRPFISLGRPFQLQVTPAARPYLAQRGSLYPEHRAWIEDDRRQVGELWYYPLKPLPDGRYCLPVRTGERWTLWLAPASSLFEPATVNVTELQLDTPDPLITVKLKPRYGPFSYLWFDVSLLAGGALAVLGWWRARQRTRERLRLLAEIERGEALPVAPEDLPELRGRRLHTDGGRELVVLRLLGAGGMGAVFEAESTVERERVAVKVLYRRTFESEGFAERFRREAEICLKLTHPGILKVLDRGEYQPKEGAARWPFMVSELLSGQDLRHVLNAGRPEWTQAVAWLQEALDALQSAHDHGVIHRDLKPENLMITSRNHVKIMDFGIARVLDQKSLTATASIIGTPHYMSPEHLSAKSVVPASDVYSLGVVLYEMLTGHPPFQAEDLMVVLMKMMSEEPPPLEALRPDLPAWLHQAVRQMLARDLTDRYPSASAARAALSPEALG